MISAPLIVRALRNPEAMVNFSLSEWDILIRQARRGNLIAKLAVILQQKNLLEKIPTAPREHLHWALATLERHQNAVIWEVLQIQKALHPLPFILLKGAAYAMAKLPTAQGRVFSDIDILVPKEKLNQVEANLMLNGWHIGQIDAYDQRYYRTWMHELPPMTHIKRGTSLDVHHAILPETAYVHPDSSKLIQNAQALVEHANIQVLSSIDMVLHSAAHLFHESELDKGLRDLSDIDNLLRQFCTQPNFWHDLIQRAIELELTRPLFYALRYSADILLTPVPDSAQQQAQIGRPNILLLKLMDSLFARALLPIHPSCSNSLSRIARLLLFIRGNWLRMPPLLLARHLFHKAFISPKQP